VLDEDKYAHLINEKQGSPWLKSCLNVAKITPIRNKPLIYFLFWWPCKIIDIDTI
jgi:hypothetical protein